MATAKDYKSNSTLDLVISNGDFKVVDSDYQSSLLLMNSNQGSFKFHPFAGMGLKRYLGSSGTEQTIARQIYVQHEADGMKIEKFIAENFTYKIALSRPGFD